MMRKLKNKIGFSVAELLLVVAILGVLGSVSAVSVVSYQRGLARFECDGIAKEIFVAAQNHLTVAKGQGYPGASYFGEKEEGEDGFYHFAVDGGRSDGADEMFRLMLPFGSIDETIRVGGNYIIRYSPEEGMVLDVFYCQGSGKFAHSMSGVDLDKNKYAGLLTYRGDGNVAMRRQYDGVVLGWYGSMSASERLKNESELKQLNPPSIEVVNKEKLYVTVTNIESDIMVIVTGLTSGAKREFHKTDFDDQFNNVLVLDDVTASGKHFSDKFKDAGFIPGEDITIQAVAYTKGEATNVPYSELKTTNSLFADGTTKTEARIANIRHLENLDQAVSNLGVNITSAVQVADMSWTDFQKNIRKMNNGGNEEGFETVNVVPLSPTIRIGSGYYPINPSYTLTYDGQSNSISDVKTTGEVDAGLFGSIGSAEYDMTIKNLELIDCNITGTTSAGALAGTLTNCTVENVLARNSTDAAETNINAPSVGGMAGGLVGVLSGGSVTKSAAAVIVNGSTYAGGLIGMSSGSVEGCYSGGHTEKGSYKEWVKTHLHDVTGGTAGGLIGVQSGGSTIGSYSTCSVSGETAGGFVGSASGRIDYCYCTGKVDGSTAHAFIGSVSSPLDLTGNSYYSGVNVVEKEGDYDLMSPGDSRVTAFDLNATTYNNFVGKFVSWGDARAYDTALVDYYSEKYNLRTVFQLPVPDPILEDGSKAASDPSYFVATHYGDWPSPEVFFVNES